MSYKLDTIELEPKMNNVMYTEKQRKRHSHKPIKKGYHKYLRQITKDLNKTPSLKFSFGWEW